MHQIEQPIEESFIAALRRRLKYYVLVGLVIGAVLISYRANPAVRQDVALATTAKPDRVTELYFNNYETLPKQLAPEQKASFSFRITNHMSESATYHYEVMDVSVGTPVLVSAGEVTLSDGQGVNETVHFSLAKANQPSKIVVALQNPSEHIDFWTVAK
jgi:hypothetical protein